MVKLISKKVKGSTLVEVVVSLTIITIIFWLNMMVFHNLNKNANLHVRTKALFVADKKMNETISDKLFIDEEIKTNGINLVKTIREYDDKIHEVTIKAYDVNGRLILQKKRLVYVP